MSHTPWSKEQAEKWADELSEPKLMHFFDDANIAFNRKDAALRALAKAAAVIEASPTVYANLSEHKTYASWDTYQVLRHTHKAKLVGESIVAGRDRQIEAEKDTAERRHKMLQSAHETIAAQAKEIAELKAKIQRWSDFAPEDYLTPHEHYLQVELAQLRAEIAKLRSDTINMDAHCRIVGAELEITRRYRTKSEEYFEQLQEKIKELETARRVREKLHGLAESVCIRFKGRLNWADDEDLNEKSFIEDMIRKIDATMERKDGTR